MSKKDYGYGAETVEVMKSRNSTNRKYKGTA